MILTNFKIYSNKKSVIAFTMAVFLIVVVCEIWALNRLSTFGEQISRLEEASSHLRMENQILTNKVAASASLNQLKDRSLMLGFRSLKHLEYLKQSDVALGR